MLLLWDAATWRRQPPPVAVLSSAWHSLEAFAQSGGASSDVLQQVMSRATRLLSTDSFSRLGGVRAPPGEVDPAPRMAVQGHKSLAGHGPRGLGLAQERRASRCFRGGGVGPQGSEAPQIGFLARSPSWSTMRPNPSSEGPFPAGSPMPRPRVARWQRGELGKLRRVSTWRFEKSGAAGEQPKVQSRGPPEFRRALRARNERIRLCHGPNSGALSIVFLAPVGHHRVCSSEAEP